KYEESIQWRYFGFLDLDLPVIRTETWFNQQLSWEESDIISGQVVARGESSTQTSQQLDGIYMEDVSPSSIGFTNIIFNPAPPIMQGTPFSISVDVVGEDIQSVVLEIEGKSLPMVLVEGSSNTWRHDSVVIQTFGTIPYSIVAIDIDGTRKSTTGSIESIMPLTAEQKQEVLNRVAAGAIAPMIVGGIVLSILAIVNFVPPKDRQPLVWLSYALNWAHLVISLGLLARNLIKNLGDVARGVIDGLSLASYYIGIILGCAITTFVFFITAALTAFTSSGSSQVLIDLFLSMGAGASLVFLIIKMMELFTGYPVGIITQSIKHHMIAITFVILITAAFFGGIGAYLKGNKRFSRDVGASMAFFAIAALIGMLIFSVKNKQYFGTIFHTISTELSHTYGCNG
ncbi:MAG: hypothetical protein Q6365_002160, partial [Candidatus Sigynarchaeota archaeon]